MKHCEQSLPSCYPDLESLRQGQISELPVDGNGRLGDAALPARLARAVAAKMRFPTYWLAFARAYGSLTCARDLESIVDYRLAWRGVACNSCASAEAAQKLPLPRLRALLATPLQPLKPSTISFWKTQLARTPALKIKRHWSGPLAKKDIGGRVTVLSKLAD